jgi:hypothetical protein
MSWKSNTSTGWSIWNWNIRKRAHFQGVMVTWITESNICRLLAWDFLMNWVHENNRPGHPGFDSWHYQIFWELVCLERGLLSLVRITEELLERKSSCSQSRNSKLTALGIRWLTTRHPLFAKVGTNSADKRRSLGQYSLLADWSHGVWFFVDLQSTQSVMLLWRSNLLLLQVNNFVLQIFFFIVDRCTILTSCILQSSLYGLYSVTVAISPIFTDMMV